MRSKTLSEALERLSEALKEKVRDKSGEAPTHQDAFLVDHNPHHHHAVSDIATQRKKSKTAMKSLPLHRVHEEKFTNYAAIKDTPEPSVWIMAYLVIALAMVFLLVVAERFYDARSRRTSPKCKRRRQGEIDEEEGVPLMALYSDTEV